MLVFCCSDCTLPHSCSCIIEFVAWYKQCSSDNVSVVALGNLEPEWFTSDLRIPFSYLTFAGRDRGVGQLPNLHMQKFN